MHVCRTRTELDDLLTRMRARGSVGLVPTMGNLHEGHVALARRSGVECDSTVVTVFVNPLQFGPNEDFGSYPRTLDEDVELLAALDVDLVFAPSDTEMYPDGRERLTRVTVPELSNILCGRNRPGHFDGVTTVVLKLLNLVRPTHAYFGEKDYQQLTLIRRMVRDLDVPVMIEGVPTVRAPDGLALSSRNQYLSASERLIAPTLAATLRDVVAALLGGDRDFAHLEADATHTLDSAGFRTDYIAIRNPHTLAAPHANDHAFVVLAAARLGKARLIDNLLARQS